MPVMVMLGRGGEDDFLDHIGWGALLPDGRVMVQNRWSRDLATGRYAREFSWVFRRDETAWVREMEKRRIRIKASFAEDTAAPP
jgi:hypothetical protein